MSRGVGTMILFYVMAMARDGHRRLRAEFVSTGHNRMMLVTYRFNGFRVLEEKGDFCLMENDFSVTVPPLPGYVTVQVDD